MILRRPFILLAALIGTLSLIASGCGGTTATVHELASFKQVQRASAAPGSARFALRLQTSIPGAKEPFSFTAEGGFDTTAKRAQLAVDLSAFADLFKSLGASFGGTVKSDLPQGKDRGSSTRSWTARRLHPLPAVHGQAPRRKTWIRGDAKELSSGDGQLGQFGSFAGTDPKDVLGLLRAISGTIEAVGTDTVRGVETSHYRATIDVKKLVTLVPAAQRQSLAGFDGLIGKSGLANIPVDVWIDSEQRVRSSCWTPARQRRARRRRSRHRSEIELYDYGKPLELELPPPEQVADASSLRP